MSPTGSDSKWFVPAHPIFRSACPSAHSPSEPLIEIPHAFLRGSPSGVKVSPHICRVATQTHALSVFKTLNSVSAKRLIRPDDDETHDEKQVALIYRLHWRQINDLEPKKPLFPKCKFSSLPPLQLYGATINKENCLDLRCTTCWFDTHTYCEMLTTTANTSITSHSYHCLWVPMRMSRRLKIRCFLCKPQVYEYKSGNDNRHAVHWNFCPGQRSMKKYSVCSRKLSL